MPRKPTQGKKKIRRTRVEEQAVRWEDLPHNEIWEQAQAAMLVGSPARSGEDSLRSVLRRRLFRLSAEEHMRYIELECARLVETLRFLRDAYRAYLEPRAKGPLVEMYWVILRYGVKDWAVMLLRSAALTYISECKLRLEEWDALFGFHGPFNDLVRASEQQPVPQATTLTEEILTKRIELLLHKDIFDETTIGGPFGRDSQYQFARNYPGRTFLLQKETLSDALQHRLHAWDAGEPWTEGLSRLFDAAQEEVLCQYAALGREGADAEKAFLDLPLFERIAHRHLIGLGGQKLPEGTGGDDLWKSLLLDLSRSGITIDQELAGNAKQVLTALRRKGRMIKTWQDSYASTHRVVLDDGKPRTLRREMMRVVHNAAKRAAYQLGKIWSTSANQPPSPTVRRSSKQR